MNAVRITLELSITQDLIDFIDSYDTHAPTCANGYNEIVDWIADNYDNLKEVMEYVSLPMVDCPYTENYELITYND